MSTPSPAQQAQPPPPNSDQTRDLLQFLREENAASRSAVREDAEASRKLLLDTVRLISLPVTALAIIAAFLGFASVRDLKQTIQAEARRQTQTEITRMQGEIRTRLDEQFQTPALQKMVKEAAKESTKAAAEPLIKSEVATQVGSRVDAEKPAIAAAVTQQSQIAVKQMGSQLDSLVKKSVDVKVSTDVDPVIQKIKDEGDFQLLITRMNADDAQAFDALSHLPPSMDPTQRNVAFAALRTVIAANNSGMFTSRQFNSPQSDDQLVAYLSNFDSYSRQAALDALSPKKNLSLLPKIVEMMMSDPSINVRCSAFRAFNTWTGQSFQCLDSVNTLSWWTANKQKFPSAR
jgi:hypothetical protein